MFVEALDLRELQRGLEQGVEHMEAGLIGGKPGTFNLHAAEATHIDAAIFTTAPGATPLLQLGHFRWAMMNEIINDILFAQPVATGNGVVEVILKAVMILRDGGGSSLRGDRMAAHRVDF